MALLSLVMACEAFAQGSGPRQSCGSLQNHYGPFDYTNPMHKREKLAIVEQHHLTRDVYELRHGATATTPLPDLDYTLRASPNHHLALDAIARLHREQGVELIPGGRYPLSCWFERARRFAPADGMVPLIYGIHLFAVGRLSEAEESFLTAVRLMPQSAEAHYNLGLVYVKQKKYSEARQYAEKAYAMGSRLPGLRDQLIRLDQWAPDQ